MNTVVAKLKYCMTSQAEMSNLKKKRQKIINISIAVKGEGIINRRSSNSNIVATGNVKKGSLNLSGRLERSCPQHRQA